MATGHAPDELLTADDLVGLMRRLRVALAEQRDEIDALNVFPVPDGDTGTNLVLTVASALDALDGDDDRTAPERLSRGALMGARGNSGVILSQVVRALAETVGSRGSLDRSALAEALERARELSYAAVSSPVEGTMLTAIRVAAETAAAHPNGTLADLAATLVDAVHEAVVATREQLDVLREAGVVDAGARGFEVVCEVLQAVVTGAEVTSRPLPHPVPAGPTPGASGEEVETGGGREGRDLEFRYEVQYLLDADDAAAQPLRDRLSELGDSVVVVAAGGLLNVHVHTNDVGAAIEAGIERGRPSRIDVTHFPDQIAARRALCNAASAGERAAAEPAAEGAAPPVGAVAVVPGPGLAQLVTELGAVPVEGRAGALPSVADLLNAVGGVDAGAVLLLPGHPNVVPTAEQAAQVSRAEGGRRLLVVGSATAAPAVLAALAVLDATAEPDEAAAALAAAAGSCRTGEVVAAVRDARTPLGDVRAGQFLVSVDGEVAGVADEPVDALERLLPAVGAGEGELVTLVIGADVDADERERAVARVRVASGGAELEVVDGGQRPARYLLGVE